MKINVDLSGPFFTHGPKPVIDSLHDAIEEVVLRGEAEARDMAQPRPGGVFHGRPYAAAHGYFQTGHYNRSIHGKTSASLNGTISDSNVVYGPWLEGVSSRNESTRFKGYGIFRKTRDKLQGMAHDIMEKHVKKGVGKIN